MHFPHGEHRANYFTTYRKGAWKLIYFYNPETTGVPSFRLYNLKKDPYETTDLSMDRRGKVRRMIRAMSRRLDAEKALYPVDDAGNELKPAGS
jgi:arylsulfatase A-like enzyme